MSEQRNGWPDETRPGVPLNPEVSGRYWMQRNAVTFVAEWSGRRAMWLIGGRYETASQAVNSGCVLLGPALTPSEVSALVEAARREAAAVEREACIADITRAGGVYSEWSARELSCAAQAAIRARGGA